MLTVQVEVKAHVAEVDGLGQVVGIDACVYIAVRAVTATWHITVAVRVTTAVRVTAAMAAVIVRVAVSHLLLLSSRRCSLVGSALLALASCFALPRARSSTRAGCLRHALLVV